MQHALPCQHRLRPVWPFALALLLSAIVHFALLLSGGFAWIHPIPTLVATPALLRIDLTPPPAPARLPPLHAPTLEPERTAVRPPGPSPKRARAKPSNARRAATNQEPHPRIEVTPPARPATHPLSLANLLSQVSETATTDTTAAMAEPSSRNLVYGISAKGMQWWQYMDDWVRRMERIGALNFPEAVRNQGLSGGPTISVVINPDGSLRALRIIRSSGNSTLDQAALRLVRSSAPFAAFPPTLAQQAGSIEIRRKWVFSTDSALSVQ